jgi:hypothetical protein
MAIALAVILPTLLIAYLGAWRVAEPWYDRRAMHPAARGMLWVSLAFSSVGFGVVLLWMEILLFHAGKIPGWGAKVYAPAIETVGAIDVLALAALALNHFVVHRRRDAASHASDAGDGIGDALEFAADTIPSGGGRTGAGLADLGSGGGGGGGGGSGWSGFGLDLDLGEDAGILVVGVGLFLLAAFLVALSLLGGAFVTYGVLRIHAEE